MIILNLEIRVVPGGSLFSNFIFLEQHGSVSSYGESTDEGQHGRGDSVPGAAPAPCAIVVRGSNGSVRPHLPPAILLAPPRGGGGSVHACVRRCVGCGLSDSKLGTADFTTFQILRGTFCRQ
jgi:hypothetical protein